MGGGNIEIDEGEYVLKGNGSKSTRPIVVNGDADITLDNVQLETNGTAMTINKGATVTLNVKGQGNSLTSTNGSGIGVYQNSNIIIKGTGSTGSQLTVTAGAGRNVGIGFIIEGYHGGGTYGDIEISGVTLSVTANTGGENIDSGTAIGMTGASYDSEDAVICGNITISNATVTANSKKLSACIGTSAWNNNWQNCSLGVISIKNSTVTATSGGLEGYSDTAACIGFGAVGSGCNVTIRKIEIEASTLNLTNIGGYKVGKGTNYGTATITEGIIVGGDSKGSEGWNPS